MPCADTLRFIANYDAVTEGRPEAALSGMLPAAKRFFSLIPVLIHYNHPLIPGYVEGNTAHGICGFTPTPWQSEYIERISAVADCTIENTAPSPAVVSLYCMGSTASCGQSFTSDIDIWVCHPKDADQSSLSLLLEKCSRISDLARKRGVEINFFAVPENKFKDNLRDSVDGDNCGTALHMLLLEEFYRTALWMAGKKLVWYLVPDEADTDKGYAAYVENLFASGVISQDKWFDLGSVGNIPASEFFGSSLWLLYKGVHMPFKAALKIMLMEAYAYEFPETQLIAHGVRRQIQDIGVADESVDAYYLTYSKIRDYLLGIGDTQRLAVIDRCFYAKIARKSGDGDLRWRSPLAMSVSHEAGLSSAEEKVLRNPAARSYQEIETAHAHAVSLLRSCAEKLDEFSKKLGRENTGIDIADLQILSRKLGAAFDDKNYKIMRTNAEAAGKNCEKVVSLIPVGSSALNRKGWFLYPSSMSPLDIVSKKCIFFSKSLMFSLLWGAANGVIGPETKVIMPKKASPRAQKYADTFGADIIDWLRQSGLKDPSSEDYLSPPSLVDAVLFLNVAEDGCAEDERVGAFAQKIDVLSFGKPPRSLVKSVHVAYRNSWGEIFMRRFGGDKAALQAIEWLLRVKDLLDKSMPKIRVHCYGRGFAGVVRQQMLDFIGSLFAMNAAGDAAPHVFMYAGQSYCVSFGYGKPEIRRFDNSLQLVTSGMAFGNEKNHKMLTRGESGKILAESYGANGVDQYFITETDDGQMFDIHESTASGEVLYFSLERDAVDAFVRETSEKISASGGTFASMPQFFMVLDDGAGPCAVPYAAKSAG